MAGNNLSTEEKLHGQNYNIYNPATDGKIYNPATDAPSVYRTTHENNPLPLQEQINKYVKLKALQAALSLILFLVGFFCLYHGHVVQRHYYIGGHVVTWILLFRGVFSAIATVLLYCGNKKEDTKLLKAFLSVGFLSYSRFFDYYAGGFNVVKRRIMELMSKHFGNPALSPTSDSNPAPIV